MSFWSLEDLQGRQTRQGRLTYVCTYRNSLAQWHSAQVLTAVRKCIDTTHIEAYLILRFLYGSCRTVQTVTPTPDVLTHCTRDACQQTRDAFLTGNDLEDPSAGYTSPIKYDSQVQFSSSNSLAQILPCLREARDPLRSRHE